MRNARQQRPSEQKKRSITLAVAEKRTEKSEQHVCQLSILPWRQEKRWSWPFDRGFLWSEHTETATRHSRDVQSKNLRNSSRTEPKAKQKEGKLSGLQAGDVLTLGRDAEEANEQTTC